MFISGDAYMREVHQKFIGAYGFEQDPDKPGVPRDVIDGRYPMKIDGRVDQVVVKDGVISCHNFEKKENSNVVPQSEEERKVEEEEEVPEVISKDASSAKDKFVLPNSYFVLESPKRNAYLQVNGLLMIFSSKEKANGFIDGIKKGEEFSVKEISWNYLLEDIGRFFDRVVLDYEKQEIQNVRLLKGH